MSDAALALGSATVSRRDALKATTALLGSALLPPLVLAACSPDAAPGPATGHAEASIARSAAADDAMWLEAIADGILPTTAASPGARAAGVGATMTLLLTDCRSGEVQSAVAAGVAALRERCRQTGASNLAALAPVERDAMLRDLDAAAVQAGAGHWFSSVRELALNAYFSSETGMTRALRYVRIPGRYQGCIPLSPGQPAND